MECLVRRDGGAGRGGQGGGVECLVRRAGGGRGRGGQGGGWNVW